MGLDLSFYRVKREIAEPLLIQPGLNDKWGFTLPYPIFQRDSMDVLFVEKNEITYQRKNYYLKEILGEIYPNPDQCVYIQVSKLEAYHLLYAMKHGVRDSYDIREYYRFRELFESALINFDWHNDFMFWSWVS